MALQDKRIEPKSHHKWFPIYTDNHEVLWITEALEATHSTAGMLGRHVMNQKLPGVRAKPPHLGKGHILYSKPTIDTVKIIGILCKPLYVYITNH